MSKNKMIPQIVSCAIIGVLVGMLIYTFSSVNQEPVYSKPYTEEPSSSRSSYNNSGRRRNNQESDSNAIKCTICLEDVSEKCKKTVLKCNHIFHTQCQKTWARHSKYCPNCKNMMYV